MSGGLTLDQVPNLVVRVGDVGVDGQVRAAAAALRRRGFSTRVSCASLRRTADGQVHVIDPPVVAPGTERAVMHVARMNHRGVSVRAIAMFTGDCWCYLVYRDGGARDPVETTPATVEQWFALAAEQARDLRPLPLN